MKTYVRVISILLAISGICINASASTALEDDIYPLGEVYVVRDTSILSPEGEVLGTLFKGQKINIDYQTQDYGILPDKSRCKLGDVSKTEPVNMSIDYDGLESENYIGYANEILSMLPSKMLDALVDSNTSVVITDYDIGKEGYYNEGTSNPEWSAVTVTYSDNHSEIYVEAGKRSVRQSLIHEIGHAVDYLQGNPSETKEFYQIYLREQKSLAADYFKSSTKEYFAEAFNIYYNKPEKRSLMKETFEFIDEIVESYN